MAYPVFNRSRKINPRRGQSLVELLVAGAVGTIMIMGALTIIAPSLRGSAQANQVQLGSSLGRQMMENVKAFTEANWHSLYDLGKGSGNKYYLITTSTPFAAATGTETLISTGADNGLIGYWKLDDATSSFASESSGSGFSGTLGSGASWVTGQYAGAVSMDGTANGYISTPYSSLLDAQNLTISIWVKPGATQAAYADLLDKGHGGSGVNGWALEQNNTNTNSFYFSYGDGTSWQGQSATTQLAANVWQNLAIVKNGTAITHYLNGAQTTNTVATNAVITANANGLEIGRSQYYGRNFSGSIDEVRVYNRAFSADEIKNIYLAVPYTRYFFVENVNRDAGGAIVLTGGSDDPSTQKVTVNYSWPRSRSYSLVSYITRSGSQLYRQTDWSGGGDNNNIVTSTVSSFATSTNIDFSTSTGSIRIKGI